MPEIWDKAQLSISLRLLELQKEWLHLNNFYIFADRQKQFILENSNSLDFFLFSFITLITILVGLLSRQEKKIK